MKIGKMTIGGVEVKRRFRPARIVCDVISLAAALVIVVTSFRHIGQVYQIVTPPGLILLFVFPVCAVGICAAYLTLTLKSRGFKRYRITKQNAQSVYDWWAFSLSLAKIPLLFAVFNAEFVFKDLTEVNPLNLFSVSNILNVLLVIIIMRFSRHRLIKLTEAEEVRNDDPEIKIKVKIADEDKEK